MQNVIDALVAIGCKEWTPIGDNDRSWHLTIKNGRDTLYFIEFRFWDFKKYGATENGWDIQAYLADAGWFTNNPDFRIIKSVSRDITTDPHQTINHILSWVDSIFIRLDLSCFAKADD